MMKLLAVLTTLLFSSILLAASPGGAHAFDGSVPPIVFHQLVNVVLFVLLLYVLLRKKVAEVFKGRSADFHSALTKAQAAKQDAEARKKEIQDRLNKLESTAAEGLQTARTEAEALRKKILADAEELTQNLRTEAQRTAQFEIERAKAELREELLTHSIQAAKKVLAENTNEADQKRLQSEFVEKIQVVR